MQQNLNAFKPNEANGISAQQRECRNFVKSISTPTFGKVLVGASLSNQELKFQSNTCCCDVSVSNNCVIK
jgi:hypothetical protein